MKIATFIYQNKKHVGIVDEVQQLVTPFVIEEFEAEFGALPILEMLEHGMPLPELANSSLALAEIQLLAPLPHPRRNIICVGKNYLDHVKEMAASNVALVSNDDSKPEYPIFFTKVPESIIATGAGILSHSDVTKKLDYEAELAVVIGKGGRGISIDDAMNHVWGYTIINDVSARDLQKRHQQWHLAKSLDTFCPMGPWIVSKDEINLANTRIKCWVNGELRQDGNTNQLIFDIATLISTLSAGMTLYAGDVIATGTPSGVGMGFQPPKFLKVGDTIRIEIENIGELSNHVVE